MKKVVYGLVDPRSGSIRYIGSSRRVGVRFDEHLRGRTASTAPWVQELAEAGLAPELRVVVPETEDWQAEEIRLILETTGLLNKRAASASPRPPRSEENERIDAAVGGALREARQAIGMSQQEAAQATGVTQAAISFYERGKRRLTFETADRLITAYGGKVSDLEGPIDKAKRAIRGED
jgi:DNA-binding XRE family transcriptional regulator